MSFQLWGFKSDTRDTGRHDYLCFSPCIIGRMMALDGRMAGHIILCFFFFSNLFKRTLPFSIIPYIWYAGKLCIFTNHNNAHLSYQLSYYGTTYYLIRLMSMSMAWFPLLLQSSIQCCCACLHWLIGWSSKIRCWKSRLKSQNRASWARNGENGETRQSWANKRNPVCWGTRPINAWPSEVGGWKGISGTSQKERFLKSLNPKPY